MTLKLDQMDTTNHRRKRAQEKVQESETHLFVHSEGPIKTVNWKSYRIYILRNWCRPGLYGPCATSASVSSCELKQVFSVMV